MLAVHLAGCAKMLYVLSKTEKFTVRIKHLLLILCCLISIFWFIVKHHSSENEEAGLLVH